MDSNIRKIYNKDNGGGHIGNPLRFESNEGVSDIYTSRWHTDVPEQVREVPEGFSVVGVYGKMYKPNWIYDVGFIVARFF